jgi:hypothetical protein
VDRYATTYRATRATAYRATRAAQLAGGVSQ